MKRFALLGCVAATALLSAGTGSATRAATLCVGNQPSCFPTLQAAVDAAQDGDTIQMYPGTYAGGVKIEKSIALKGAGAGSTIIRGGGPVLTIGIYNTAGTQPTVSIDGVTITGSVTRSSDIARDLFVDGAYADGGGVEIEPGINRFHSADVTISNSVIEGNRVAPMVALPGSPDCPSGPCPRGPLTITNSAIEDNATSATEPNGLYVWGSGIDKGGVPIWCGGSATRVRTFPRSTKTAPSIRACAQMPLYARRSKSQSTVDASHRGATGSKGAIARCHPPRSSRSHLAGRTVAGKSWAGR